MSWKNTVAYLVILALVPLIPVVWLFTQFVSDATVQGTFGGLEIKLVGAFAAYFLLVYFMYHVTRGLIELQPEREGPGRLAPTLRKVLAIPAGSPGFKIAGEWSATYTEYDTGIVRTESVRMNQDGSIVWGYIDPDPATTHKNPPWRFYGTVRDGVLVASYWSEQIQGHYQGSFTLKVEKHAEFSEGADPKALEMNGFYTGFEKALGKILQGQYRWVRK